MTDEEIRERVRAALRAMVHEGDPTQIMLDPGDRFDDYEGQKMFLLGALGYAMRMAAALIWALSYAVDVPPDEILSMVYQAEQEVRGNVTHEEPEGDSNH